MLSKRIACLLVGSAVCSGLLLSGSDVASASAVQPPETVEQMSDEMVGQSVDLEQAFTLLESIPDSVLEEGDAALAAWGSARGVPVRSTRGSILGCTGAIALVVASTAFPAAKILKIKRLITSLGGVTKAVRLFWGASFSYEKVRALGGAAAALGAELLGITQIRQQCFR